MVHSEIEKLKRYVLQAIWLQTDNGFDWAWDNDEEDQIIPYCIEDIEAQIIDKYVMSEAYNWENSRIRDYLGL